MSPRTLVVACHLFGLGLSIAAAQEIPRPDYLTYIPPGLGLPTAQQPATVQFHLYGDTAAPGYVDQSPRNGIDDRRDAWLTRVAVRFAPWMVRNTIDFPMDWRLFVNQGAAFPLFIDRFATAGDFPRLTRSEIVDMKNIEQVPCEVPESLAANDTTPDCRLLTLLDHWGPNRRPAPRPEEPGNAEQMVMFFDFPGEDPASWNAEFEGPVSHTIARKYLGWAKTYVHPFITTVEGRPESDPRYQLVFQYWFFYPYNDAGNIHEGDWEHLNVVVTTRAQGAEPFTGEQIAALVSQMESPDNLIIRELQYYFHHWVFRLDYFLPNIYLPRADWERQVDNLDQDRFGEKAIWEQTRRQAYMDEAETILNFHPVIFIGGDNRGLQQLIAKPTRLGRASHGSFPFVGLYKDVGPENTGELVRHIWDRFRTPPDSNAPESEPIVRLDNPDRIEIIPDWERVEHMAYTDPVARATWSWLLLPIRFGYPATRSPFAGIVKYAETGNLSIESPPFNGGWNRAGAAPGYATYQPHRLSSYFPASLQDNFQTGWGFFNLTVPTLVTLPGLDIIYRIVSAPVRATSKRTGPAFFNSETVPFRVIGISGGVSTFKPSEDWLNLFIAGDLGLALLDSLLARSGTTDIDLRSGATRIDAATQWLLGLNLYIGRRVVSENSLRHSRSSMGADIVVSNVPGVLPLDGELDFWEYVGSLRYNLQVDAIQPFVKLGYGLSWYQLQDVTFDGNQLGSGASEWVRRPSLFDNLLPNTFHLGAGLEYVPLRSVVGPDVGIKADVAVHSHNLGTQPRGGNLSFAQEARIYRWVFSIAGTLSF